MSLDKDIIIENDEVVIECFEDNIEIELKDYLTFWASILGHPSSNQALVNYLNTLLAKKQDLCYYIVATEESKELIAGKETGTVAFVKATKNLYIYYNEGTTPEWIMLIRDLSNYYTKPETDALLAFKANIADVYSKIDADAKFATIINLNTEATNRANADTALQTNITTEASIRASADNILQANIETEIANRISADNAIQADLEIEANTRAVADINLQTSITNEATTRASEDTSIRNSIKDGKLYIQKNGITVATFSANQAGDTTANIVADTPKWGNITGTLNNQTDLQDALDLKANLSELNTEINNRIAAVNMEATTRASVDNTLLGNINLEISNRISAINLEANTRANEDSNLQDEIDSVSEIVDTKVTKNTDIIGSTKCKITYDIKGLVTAGADLIVSDIPSLPLSKISDVTSTAQEVNYLTGATSNVQGQINGKLNTSDVINNVTSTTTNQALSANMGKELQDQINNLKQRGRYLSIWNCTTGLAETTPTVNPYNFKAGDYFLVGTVASQGGTNYRPNGATYDKDVPSTTVETGAVVVNDAYYYDGTSWTLLHTEQPTVAFSTLAGSPYDNANLTTALNAKVTGNNAITGATKCKITYDSKGLVTAGTDLSASDIPNLTLSKISDVTASASELNILDGATLTTTELNYVDGVTSNIQTQLNNKVEKNNAITGATKCKITYDSKGLVTSGTNLTASDIPDISATYYLASNPSGYQANVLEGVQINSTDLTITNKKVNIPVASNSTLGVIKVDNTTIQANNGVITAKSLDGLTASIAELNYVDGVTSDIQTQLNNKANSSDLQEYTAQEVETLWGTI